MYIIEWVIYKRYCQDIEYIISGLWATEKVQWNYTFIFMEIKEKAIY